MAKQRESIRVVDPFTAFLKTRGWDSYNIHGNQYQEGLPDAYITHPDYAPRWVEYKVRDDYDKVKLTSAQKKKFPKLNANNVPIYIIAAKDLRKRGKAFDETKCKHLYLKILSKPNVMYAFSTSMMHLLY